MRCCRRATTRIVKRIPCHVTHLRSVFLARTGAAATARAHARPARPGIFASTNLANGDDSPRFVDAAATTSAVNTECARGAQHRSAVLAAAVPNAFAAPPSALAASPARPNHPARANVPTASLTPPLAIVAAPANHSAPRSRCAANRAAPRVSARGRFARRGRSRDKPNLFHLLLGGVRALRWLLRARLCTVIVGAVTLASSIVVSTVVSAVARVQEEESSTRGRRADASFGAGVARDATADAGNPYVGIGSVGPRALGALARASSPGASLDGAMPRDGCDASPNAALVPASRARVSSSRRRARPVRGTSRRRRARLQRDESRHVDARDVDDVDV